MVVCSNQTRPIFIKRGNIMKKLFILIFIFSSAFVFSQPINDNIYGDYSIEKCDSPYSRMFISIDGTLYLFQNKNTSPAIYQYAFIDNLMFIGKVGYYYTFTKVEKTWVLTLIPAFGEAGYEKVVCKKEGNL